MNKKDLVIVALATFCLTATLFMILPSKSGLPYDPWADVSGPTPGVEDGTINMRDIQYEILHFNTQGDTTKNVRVTNPTYDARGIYFNRSWINHTATWAWLYSPAGYGWTGGYSRLFIHLFVSDISPKPAGDINTSIYVRGILWNSTAIIASYEGFGPDFCNATIFQASQVHEWYPQTSTRFAVSEFKVKAETIEYIAFNITSLMESGWIEGTIVTYLRNE